MNDPWDDLASTLDSAWQVLNSALTDRSSPARRPVLATVGREEGAEARTVILRSVDANSATLEIHTDRASQKVAEIERKPNGTLLIWDESQELQLRLRAHLSVRPGTAAEWDRVPAASRRGYGGSLPGTTAEDPSDFAVDPDPDRFAVIVARIEEIETLRLGNDHHRRARFRRADGFGGTWIAP